MRGEFEMGTLRGFPNPPAMVRGEQSSPAPHATSLAGKLAAGFRTGREMPRCLLLRRYAPTAGRQAQRRKHRQESKDPSQHDPSRSYQTADRPAPLAYPNASARPDDSLAVAKSRTESRRHPAAEE